MKKLFSTFALLATAALTLAAQNDKPSHPFNISIQGGALVSVNDNAFSYVDNGKTFNLITPQGSLAFGYDFNHRFGIRLSAGYGKNASACNTVQTAGHGFYPYTFSSVNVFADALLNLGLKESFFSPKLYAGLGCAHTFNFTDAGHPWQQVTKSNTVFGFRAGFIAQFDITSHFGLYIDLCGEAYTDKYNGLMPNAEDQKKVSGYAGFPLDLRGLASLGVIFHF